ncbi:hypothetical protein [Anaerotignum sp.]|uniref:hypothetical protein n=1 Tax=Anaerotignum sp. TaxID=2039241 RepID=UPI002896FA7F|nr:hypothetical protein [Anaerotignum sp.]
MLEKDDAIRMMIKMIDGDSFEENRSLVQELTFNRLEEELQKRGLEFTEVQMKNLSILSSDDIYTNMGLLVSDQCKHSIKFTVFQGTDIYAKVLSAEEQKYLPILRLFDNQKQITRPDVEEALGSGTIHAINILKEMLDKDLISKIGNFNKILEQLDKDILKSGLIIELVDKSNDEDENVKVALE